MEACETTYIHTRSKGSSVSTSDFPELIAELELLEPQRDVLVIPDNDFDGMSSIIDIVRSEPVDRSHVLSGMLQVRRSGILRHSWKNMHCVLEDHILKCSFRVDDKFPKYFLNFELISVTVKATETELFISPKGSSKTFGFKSVIAGVFGVWKDAIMQTIAGSRGNRLTLIKQTKKVRWWKVGTRQRHPVTYSQFVSHVETGDLLLFKSKTASSLALRLATMSNYDHVAFLFPLETGEIFLMESLGRTGVQVIGLDWFIANSWHLLYKKIVHRKLICNRDTVFFNQFMTHAKAWEGRPYRLNMSILMHKVSFEQEYDHFFCSQLVAALYKKLDLLPSEVSSCNYWPGNFSDSKSLSLRAPAYLGEERVIKFDC